MSAPWVVILDGTAIAPEHVVAIRENDDDFRYIDVLLVGGHKVMVWNLTVDQVVGALMIHKSEGGMTPVVGS